MSFHRFLYLCGWTAVILLAIAGFAAFNAGSFDQASDPSAGSAWGEAAGAVSAQGWMTLAGARTPASIVPPGVTNPTRADVTTQETAARLVTGWLDSVALRSLVETEFSTSDVNRAVRLAWCLSRFDIDAVDPDTGSLGLFQIDPDDWPTIMAALDHATGSDPFDPALSTEAAAYVAYQGDGWDYWSCDS